MIAAKGVIPRQPVDNDRWLVLQKGEGLVDHHLVGADHALGVDDGLRVTSRARGQQEFCDRVGTDRVMGRSEVRMLGRGEQIGQPRDVTSRHAATRSHDLGFGGNAGGKRKSKFIGVIGVDQSGRQQLHHESELAIVFRDQRIGRRDRAEGNAGIERAEGDQRMVDRVAGEDDDRPLRREPARQQCRGDATAGAKQLRVADLAPAGAIALGHEDAIRRRFGPMMQTVREPDRVVAERRLRFQTDRAIRAMLDRHREVAERDRAQRRCNSRVRLVGWRAHEPGFTLAVL